MRPMRAAFVVLGVVFAMSTGASAATFLEATLTHAQETTRGTFLTDAGAPRRESFGNASFVINDAMTELTFTATIFNIDVTGQQTADTFDDLVAAHIHAATPPGANAGVRWGFFGTPDNDINPKDLVLVPFIDVAGGTFTSTWNMDEGNNTTLTAQLPSILAGLSYINFHTTQFGGGEIRGQIVPEPATVGLLVLGALALFSRRSVRRG